MTAAFVPTSGSGITTFTIQAGSSVNDASTNAFSLPLSLLAAGYTLTNQLKLMTITATYNLTLLFTANANIGTGSSSRFTAGSVKVSYCTVAI